MTPREDTGRLRTVTGTIATSDITGPVLSHEHLGMDLRWPARPQQVGSDPARWLDEEKGVQRELNELRKEHGLGLVVDLTCSGMGRNAAALARISAGSRVAVVAGTGVFTEPFHPAFVREALAAGKELADLSLDELRAADALFEADVYDWLDPARAVDRRDLPGGPARARIVTELDRLARELDPAGDHATPRSQPHEQEPA